MFSFWLFPPHSFLIKDARTPYGDPHFPPSPLTQKPFPLAPLFFPSRVPPTCLFQFIPFMPHRIGSFLPLSPSPQLSFILYQGPSLLCSSAHGRKTAKNFVLPVLSPLLTPRPLSSASCKHPNPLLPPAVFRLRHNCFLFSCDPEPDRDAFPPLFRASLFFSSRQFPPLVR